MKLITLVKLENKFRPKKRCGLQKLFYSLLLWVGYQGWEYAEPSWALQGLALTCVESIRSEPDDLWPVYRPNSYAWPAALCESLARPEIMF